MKQAFSTLAEPTWPLERFLDEAVRLGYDGIDFRGIGEQIDVTRMREFNEALRTTLDALARRNLRVAGLSTSARCVGEQAQLEAFLDEVRRYCELATRTGRPCVRVFGGQIPAGMKLAEALPKAAEQLRRYGDIAAGLGVTLVVETHDDWCASQTMRELIEKASHPAVFVVWDVHHPWRVTGESPQQTWETLGRWIRYVHLKDAKGQPGGPQELCHTGEGNVPVAEALRVLKANGYDGWLTFEYEKRWHPELPSAEEGLRRHIDYVRRFL